eukprot:5060740-Prorocentrum_lima.AAC.1
MEGAEWVDGVVRSIAVAGWAVLDGRRKGTSAWPDTPSTCCPSRDSLPLSGCAGPDLPGIP